MKRKNTNKIVSFALVIIGYAVMMILITTGKITRSMQGMLVPICSYIVMAISLNLTVGILGELSLGHAGFMSMGAFTGTCASLMMTESVPNPDLRLGISMVIGAVFGGLAGFLIGIPVLRLKGDYLAIVTLAFGEIIKSIINNFYLGFDKYGLHIRLLSEKGIKLEDGGRMLIQGAMGISKIKKISTFTAGFILIILTLFIVYHLVESRYGRAIMAIRDNRIAAESVGVDVTKYKMTAFVISAAFAGAAGALFAQNYSTITANKFDFNTSILILVLVVLGGLGNITGSIISATLLTILPEALRSFATYRMLVYAIVLIVVMLFTNATSTKMLINNVKASLGRNKEEEGQ
jgi:branched-chain amino acid transport system permease protein